MSFSRPQLQNPSKKFIEWKSDDHCFAYYDKETQKNVPIPLPVYFIVLDELSCISGYCEKHKTNLFSNEVRSTVKEPLLVRTFKGGERLYGLYDNIKGSAKELGGKYTKSVYCALIAPEQEPELVNIRLRGAACSAWISKNINTGKAVIQVKEFTEEKKGKTVYNVPVFSAVKLTPELTDTAIAMDTVLQEYLKDYFAQKEEDLAVAAEALTPEPQPEYIADAQAKLNNITSRATQPANAILDAGWMPKKNTPKAPAPTGPISDPALLDNEGPRNIDPEEVDMDPLPF